MNPDLLPMISYIFITTFTPGPNNLSSAAAGIKVGLRRTLPYLFGISSGFFCVLASSGLFSVFLRTRYSAIAPYLKWLGFSYMIWLAVSPFIKHKSAGLKDVSYSYPTGLLLQIVNPKSILYGITIYASFFDLLAGSVPRVLFSAFLLTIVGFVSILTWTLAGTGLTKILKGPKSELIFNVGMGILLVYSAISIVSHS